MLGQRPRSWCRWPTRQTRGCSSKLSGYGADLTEALHALDLAVQSREDGPPLADASAYLIGYAVVAYCRATSQSDVRPPLTHQVDIPAEFTSLHQKVRAFRNATIAHSQSELSVTYPVGVLDPVSLELSYVSSVTVTSPLPQHEVQQSGNSSTPCWRSWTPLSTPSEPDWSWN